jgi:hypothetical protein
MGIKVGRNDPCPCGSMQKYKNCCLVKGIDYSTLSHGDYVRNLTIRGKNKWFLNSVFDILDFNTNIQEFKDWQGFVIQVKKTLTPEKVRHIYELIPVVWPDKEDFYRCIHSDDRSLSGLFIGDYRVETTAKLINKYGLYEDVIVLVDPIVDPRCIAEEYNPVVHPERHLISTLHSLLLWLQLLPWIDDGVVQIIRDPGDFDYQLRIDSFNASKKRYEESGLNQLIKEEAPYDEFHDRVKRYFKLSMPDDMILAICNNHNFDPTKMMEYIRQERLYSIDHVEGGCDEQYLTTFSGTNYEMGKYLCSISKSHLLTDLKIRWLEMDYDRKSNRIQNNDWESFSKHFQQVPLPYLNGLRTIDVMKLRSDGHLNRMRDFLKKLWLRSSPDSATDQHIIEQLKLELDDEVRFAEKEWKDIDRSLNKWFVPNIVPLGMSVLAGTPWWMSGITAALTGAVAVVESANKHKSFQQSYPAGFFLERK